MARRSLRPELNRIRAWVHQGRTDAWIAHQLDVSVQQIQGFKRDQSLEAGEEVSDGAVAVGLDEEIDLRAEDDALIAAELDAAVAEREAAEAAAAEAAAVEAAAKAEARAKAGADGDEDDDDKPSRRRRGRRGGRRSRRKAGTPLEATFDHGEEGYGLWLDPAVQDDPVYAEHWAGHRAVEVTIEEDQIVIKRVGGPDEEDDADSEDAGE